MLNPLTSVLSLCGGLAVCAVMASSCRAAEPAAAATPATVAALMTRDLLSAPGKEVVMLTVQYPGAGASLPHRHDAQVFVYVLEGHVTMQIRGSPAVTFAPG